MLWTFHLFSIKAVFVGGKLVIYLLHLPTKLPDFIKAGGWILNNYRFQESIHLPITCLGGFFEQTLNILGIVNVFSNRKCDYEFKI
jgi:hypothetical protein